MPPVWLNLCQSPIYRSWCREVYRKFKGHHRARRKACFFLGLWEMLYLCGQKIKR